MLVCISTLSLSVAVLSGTTSAGGALISARDHFRVVPLRDGQPWPASWSNPEQPAPEAVSVAGASTSTNWAGYVDDGAGSDFTGVSASWTVPALKGHVVGAASSWVGIGGSTTPGLVQAGVEVRDTLGYDEYLAWYELYPQNTIVLGMVAPGDVMDADIVQDGPATWTITLTDVTERTTWTGPVADNLPGTTAEWIEEAPSSATTGKRLSLVNFSSVTFSHLSVEGPAAATGLAQPVYMVSSDAVLAYPSPYSTASGSFSVTYGPSSSGVVGFPPVAIATGTTSPTTTAPPASQPTTTEPGVALSPSPAGGYWLVASDGSVFAFGEARSFGSVGTARRRPADITGIAATPDHKGYWLVGSDGGVFAFGDAPFLGSLPELRARHGSARGQDVLSARIVGITATEDAHGYYLVSSQGGVYAFGDARFVGSCGYLYGGCPDQTRALVTDGTGKGYWLVLADTSSEAFGDAPALRDRVCLGDALSTFVADAVRSPEGGGYWTLLGNGTTCRAGDVTGIGIWAAYAAAPLGNPAVSMVTTDDGAGAWLVFANGDVSPYGTALDLGDLAGSAPAVNVVAAAGW